MKHNRYATQGRLIIEQLKRRPMTYMQMLALGVSTCPWRRCQEALRHMPEWRLDTSGRNRQGLVTWRVVRACAQK